MLFFNEIEQDFGQSWDEARMMWDETNLPKMNTGNAPWISTSVSVVWFIGEGPLFEYGVIPLWWFKKDEVYSSWIDHIQVNQEVTKWQCLSGHVQELQCLNNHLETRWSRWIWYLLGCPWYLVNRLKPLNKQVVSPLPRSQPNSLSSY